MTIKPTLLIVDDVEANREALIMRLWAKAELPLKMTQDTPIGRRAVAGTALDWTYRPAQRQSWRASERK